MAESHDGTTVRTADKLNAGDEVIVHVNSRATDHIGTSSFRATVKDVSFGDVVFEPDESLENQEDIPTHTWYSDIGYIHGFHTGLGRYSDIGKVRKVEKLE